MKIAALSVVQPEGLGLEQAWVMFLGLCRAAED